MDKSKRRSDWLEMWVIYDKPRDFPNEFIARKWIGELPTDIFARSKDVNVLRKALADKGLVAILPMPGDDPVILETWI